MEESIKEMSGIYDSVYIYSLFWRSETRITIFMTVMFCICFLFPSHKYGDITLQCLLPFSQPSQLIIKSHPDICNI